jgi:hypothetical protein
MMENPLLLRQEAVSRRSSFRGPNCALYRCHPAPNWKRRKAIEACWMSSHHNNWALPAVTYVRVRLCCADCSTRAGPKDIPMGHPYEYGSPMPAPRNRQRHPQPLRRARLRRAESPDLSSGIQLVSSFVRTFEFQSGECLLTAHSDSLKRGAEAAEMKSSTRSLTGDKVDPLRIVSYR